MSESTNRPAQERTGRRVRVDAPEPASKRKVNLVLSADAAKRLGVHALMVGEDRSTIVEGWISTHCRRFVVQDRGGPPPARPSANLADGGNPEVETLTAGETIHDDRSDDAPAGEGSAAPAPSRRRRAQAAGVASDRPD
ncbi:MAG: hypothetical protein AB7I30_03560 [Isosphaeraceae bacterium]